jgi:hypothetical protein
MKILSKTGQISRLNTLRIDSILLVRSRYKHLSPIHEWGEMWCTIFWEQPVKLKLRCLSQRANYADRATAACQRN